MCASTSASADTFLKIRSLLYAWLANLDPQQECSYYDDPEVTAMSSQYPAIWEIASIVQGDTEANAAYNAIISQPNFPNIAPKGTPQGDFSGVQYNDSDPDCWYVWQCAPYSLCD